VNAKTQAELKRAAAEMQRYHVRMKITLAPLEADMNFALAQLVKDKGNQQFWRRTMIRCVLAYIEALTWNVKHGIPIIASISRFKLTSADFEIIQEQRTVEVDGRPEVRPKFLKFRDNLKATFSLFGKVHGENFKVNCNQDFDALCKTYDLRSRLTHPKGPMDPNVSDSDIALSQQGLKWLSWEYRRLMEQCTKAIPKLSKNK
jgi:hypothetical protein